jgi:hypothetical protein
MHQETSANQQSDYVHVADQLEEEVHSDNQTVGNEPSEDDLIQIGGNYVHVADQLHEMVRDAMGYDGYTNLEFDKLKRMVTVMKTPLYPGCKKKYTKLFTSLKLRLKAIHHMTDWGFKALLDLLKDMLLEGNEIPKITYEAKQNICPLGLKRYTLVRVTAFYFVATMQTTPNALSPECLDISKEMMGVMKKGGMELLKRWHGISL